MGRKRVYPLPKVGDRYGKLVVAEPPFLKGEFWYVTCTCDCGKITHVPPSRLGMGKSKSCGCSAKEHPHYFKHGESHDHKTKLYKIWCSMRQRCYYSNQIGFKNYGGRGITMCDEWRSDYVVFRDWALSNGYSDGLQIDRIDNNGNYHPGNCRWATPTEQARNKRSNVLVTAFGETKCIADWADDSRCVVGRKILEHRLRVNKWIAEYAITEPTNRHRSNSANNLYRI